MPLLISMVDMHTGTVYITSSKEISDMLLNRKIKVPGVLIEAGFLSNPNDRYLLKQESYQEKLCENITSGILKYFGLN